MPATCRRIPAGLALAATRGKTGDSQMTNRIALVLGLMILALFIADAIFLHWNLPVVMGKKIAELIEYLSFWR